MKSVIILSLACATLSFFGCTEKKTQEVVIDPWVTFDLGVDRFGSWQAANLIDSMRNLAGPEQDSMIVCFLSDGKSVRFEVLSAEPRDAYEQKPFTKDAQGKWMRPQTPALPPGGLDLTWVTVETEGVTLGVNELSDQEFSEWLDLYAKVLADLQERSALVIDASTEVSCARLFTVLSLLSEKKMDRILMERKMVPQAAAEVPAAPIAPEDDLD